jgi:hypothetical protein
MIASGGRFTGACAPGADTPWGEGAMSGGRGVAAAADHCGGGAMMRVAIGWPDVKLLCDTTVIARGASRLA